jgi:hypothetical protein
MNKKTLLMGLALLSLQTINATEFVTFYNNSKYKVEITIESHLSNDTIRVALEPNATSKPEIVNKKDPIIITVLLENNKIESKHVVFDGRTNTWEISVPPYTKTIMISKKFKPS